MSYALPAGTLAAPALHARTRWVQLLLGLVCMMAISSPQYVWTLFTRPLGAALAVTPGRHPGDVLAADRAADLLLAGARLPDRPLRPAVADRRRVLLTAASWLAASTVTSLAGLYLSYGVLGGLGTGIVYVGVVGLMVRWFPDRRGFAAGVVAAATAWGRS